MWDLHHSSCLLQDSPAGHSAHQTQAASTALASAPGLPEPPSAEEKIWHETPTASAQWTKLHGSFHTSPRAGALHPRVRGQAWLQALLGKTLPQHLRLSQSLPSSDPQRLPTRAPAHAEHQPQVEAPHGHISAVLFFF